MGYGSAATQRQVVLSIAIDQSSNVLHHGSARPVGGHHRRAHHVIDKDELELRFSLALTPLLSAIALFCLTAMSSIAVIGEPLDTIMDEVLLLTGICCVSGAAVIADAVLDRYKLDWSDRLRFMGSGYFFFSLIMGAMTFCSQKFIQQSKILESCN